MTVPRNVACALKARQGTHTAPRWHQYLYYCPIGIPGSGHRLWLPNFATINTTVLACVAHLIQGPTNGSPVSPTGRLSVLSPLLQSPTILDSEQILFSGVGSLAYTDTGVDQVTPSDVITLLNGTLRGTLLMIAAYIQMGVGEVAPTTSIMVPEFGCRYEDGTSALTDKTATPLLMPLAPAVNLATKRALVPAMIVANVAPITDWTNPGRTFSVFPGYDSRGGDTPDIDYGHSGNVYGLLEEFTPECAVSATGSQSSAFGQFMDTDYGADLAACSDVGMDKYGVNSDADQPNTTAHGDTIFGAKQANATKYGTKNPAGKWLYGTSFLPTDQNTNHIRSNPPSNANYGRIAMMQLNARVVAETVSTTPNILEPTRYINDQLLFSGPPELITDDRINRPEIDTGAGSDDDGLHAGGIRHQIQKMQSKRMFRLQNIPYEFGGVVYRQDTDATGRWVRLHVACESPIVIPQGGTGVTFSGKTPVEVYAENNHDGGSQTLLCFFREGIYSGDASTLVGILASTNLANAAGAIVALPWATRRVTVDNQSAKSAPSGGTDTTPPAWPADDASTLKSDGKHLLVPLVETQYRIVPTGDITPTTAVAIRADGNRRSLSWLRRVADNNLLAYLVGTIGTGKTVTAAHPGGASISDGTHLLPVAAAVAVTNNSSVADGGDEAGTTPLSAASRALGEIRLSGGGNTFRRTTNRARSSGRVF